MCPIGHAAIVGVREHNLGATSHTPDNPETSAVSGFHNIPPSAHRQEIQTMAPANPTFDDISDFFVRTAYNSTDNILNTVLSADHHIRQIL